MRFDVGSNSVANWPRNEAVRSIGLLMFRPGLSQLRGRETNGVVAGFSNPDYRETFGSLDLELRFVVETSDSLLRPSSTEAVNAALEALRMTNSKARR
jgi:hypothetical protein